VARREDITDASVPQLIQLRQLEYLDDSDTSIDKLSPAAKALRAALPNCLIRLPKTKKEREMERVFNNQKWGGQ
jgi:hypothetical protein